MEGKEVWKKEEDEMSSLGSRPLRRSPAAPAAEGRAGGPEAEVAAAESALLICCYLLCVICCSPLLRCNRNSTATQHWQQSSVARTREFPDGEKFR